MIFLGPKLFSKSLIILFLIVSFVGFYLSRFFCHPLRPIVQGVKISQIIETDQFEEIKSHIEDDVTLVIFDIDNTLGTPEHEIGTEQWFEYLLNIKRKEGLSFADAVEAVVPLHYRVHQYIPFHLIEKNTPELLQSLSEKSIPVIALTARSDILKQCTIKQLTDAGIKIPFQGLSEHELCTKFDVPAQFSQGIMFCGKNDKGTVLFYMLDQAGYKPDKIIFVDDKYSNLASVERACIQRKIPFVGIRYSRLDERVAHFDPIKAEEELKELFGSTLEESLALAFQEYGPMY